MRQPENLVPLSKDGSTLVTDEVYNTRISALAAVLAVIGTGLLLFKSLDVDQPYYLLAMSIYGFGLINLFIFSALHHGVDGSAKTNHVLRQFDYFAIFVMIAGSFTPFCLLLLHKPLGWIILGLVWGLTVLGIVLKAAWPAIPRWMMLVLYLGMGWLGLLIFKPVYQVVHESGIFFLILGGLFFSVGGVIYGLEKPNPVPGRFGFHEIWHCFVVAGAASHFYLIYHYL